MAEKSKTQQWRIPADGWIVGTLRGEKAFSDGHAMFVGERNGASRTLPNKSSFDSALKKCLTGKLLPTKLVERIWIGTLPCVGLKGKSWIQQKYYDYAMRFKGVQLFLVAKQEYGPRAVICKVGEKIVGAIMPIRP